MDDVLVADASRRTTTLNAYVSGFGGTRRVVVYDNLVEDLPEAEALSVVAHELAHARHRDVVTGSVLGAAGALFGVGLLSLVVGAMGERRRLSMADPAVVPLVLALAAVATFVASPVENTVSRQIETRADVDALETTGDSDAFVAMQRQLALRSFSDPTPPALSQFWFGSHPTSLQRIAIARQLAAARRLRKCRRGRRSVTGGLVDRSQMDVQQLARPAELVPSPTVLQVLSKSSVRFPPKANTTTTIRAAIPEINSPYSTADAPSFMLLRVRSVVPTGSTSRSRTPFALSTSRSGRSGVAVADRLAGVVEDGGQVVTEREHDDDDESGDAGDQQAVLDGGGAALVTGRQVSSENGAQVVKHGCFSFVGPRSSEIANRQISL